MKILGRNFPLVCYFKVWNLKKIEFPLVSILNEAPAKLQN
jgi:hypothetical protein